MSNKMINQIGSEKSSLKFAPQSADDDSDNLSQKITVSPIGKLRKFTCNSIRSNELNLNEIESNTLNFGCDKCDKCVQFRDNILKSVTHIRTYVENINDRLNMTYHKTAHLKNSYSSDVEMALSADYYHTIFYSELDKFKVGGEAVNQFRYLMKSLRLFNDKFEYIVRKHENFEKMAQEVKNFKISNKIEELSLLAESEIAEAKLLSEHSIFKNFNTARENFESCIKDIKNSLNGNADRFTNVNDIKILESFELNSDKENNSKETFMKNELSRMVKENTSLRLELNYIYERLREDNKIYEIKEDVLIKKSINLRDSVTSNSNNYEINSNTNNNLNNSGKFKRSKTFNYGSGGSNHNNFSSSLVVFKVKNEKKDEDFWIAKNYIKMLRQSEFYTI